jgi:hypothetical protein
VPPSRIFTTYLKMLTINNLYLYLIFWHILGTILYKENIINSLKV